jgi:hypothetical protein
MVPKAAFVSAFWRCYNTLADTATPDVGMPGYFRFLTLLGARWVSGARVCRCLLCIAGAERVTNSCATARVADE